LVAIWRVKDDTWGIANHECAGIDIGKKVTILVILLESPKT